MRWITDSWKTYSTLLVALWPLSLIFRLIIAIRILLVSTKVRPLYHAGPIIVVGNISIGGTGKTPLIIHLANYLRNQGFSPGIVSRGYGGQASSYPHYVKLDDDPNYAGDEPLLIARRTGCPVVLDPDRIEAVKYLFSQCDVTVILSDDGLQHYKMYRDIEICMVDGSKMFGNSLCLPAGPLREPVERLKDVDFVVVTGAADKIEKLQVPIIQMSMKAKSFVNLISGEIRPFGGAPFNIGNNIQAVCGIGNPERFYSMLEPLPYPITKFSFPDHHRFTSRDFTPDLIAEHQPIVMTEKDAIKCKDFATKNFWYVDVEVAVPEYFLTNLEEKIKEKKKEIQINQGTQRHG